MIYLILQHLLSHTCVEIPTLFVSSFTRMILAALTTFVFTLCMGPWWIRKLSMLKTWQGIRVSHCPILNHLHQKKKETPTMGGTLMLIGMLLSLLLWMDLCSSFTLILAIATLWLGLIGMIDDFLKIKRHNVKGLSWKKKCVFQLMFAFLLSWYLLVPAFAESIHFGDWFARPNVYYGEYFFPFKTGPLFTLSGWGIMLAFFFNGFLITGSSNAANVTDGLDGLAAGSIFLISVVLSMFAFLSSHWTLSQYVHLPYIEGCGEIAIYLGAIAGACLGFLWYNGHPAQIFMGDTGSLALGGILGTTAILMRRECVFALVAGVFILEAGSVILQVLSYRYRNKKRIFMCAPLHHHFELQGWKEEKVVIRFWIIGLLFAVFGLASLHFY